MIVNAWVALALGVAIMIGGVATVSAVGVMNGDCDQVQDKLQLKDGTGDDCSDDIVDDDVCDSCNDYDWDFLYGETELEPPHQSECGQE